MADLALVILFFSLAGVGLLALAFFWLHVTGVRLNFGAVLGALRVRFKFWRRKKE